MDGKFRVHPGRFDTVLLMLMFLLMSMLRLPSGCIAFVPISPDVMKIPFCAWFGFAHASH
jgi:hypothetical protein